jgi:hypothetical protein
MVESKIVVKPKCDYLGLWYYNDPNTVILNVGTIWEWAAKHTPARATDEDRVEVFTRKINDVFLQELICTIKTKDKLRVKNGNCCKPNCRIERIVDFMSNPDDWGKVKRLHARQRKTEEVLQK